MKRVLIVDNAPQVPGIIQGALKYESLHMICIGEADNRAVTGKESRSPPQKVFHANYLRCLLIDSP